MSGPSVVEATYCLAGAVYAAGMCWVVTSERWHRLFHRNHARYLMFGRAVCARCVRQWQVCSDCERRPCVCAARAEAQKWIASHDQ